MLTDDKSQYVQLIVLELWSEPKQKKFNVDVGPWITVNYRN